MVLEKTCIYLRNIFFVYMRDTMIFRMAKKMTKNGMIKNYRIDDYIFTDESIDPCNGARVKLHLFSR